MTEYIPKEGYIEFIDSNYVEIKQRGKLFNKNIDLRDWNKNFSSKELILKKMRSEKEIAFEIKVKNPKVKIEDEDAKSFIYFVTDSLTKGRLIAESSGCK